MIGCLLIFPSKIISLDSKLLAKGVSIKINGNLCKLVIKSLPEESPVVSDFIKYARAIEFGFKIFLIKSALFSIISLLSNE